MTGSIRQSAVRPVVVGVDGSAASWRAIQVAAWEARQRQAPIVLLHGYPDDDPYLWYGWAPPFVATWDAKTPAAAMLDETARRVRERYPDSR